MAIPVKLPVFEGPLDLLMHLIDKNKIDIYDIPIMEITDQYLEYVRQMDHEDMDVTSEFLVMAATLLDIKSRMLLPREKDEETGEETDPREELVQRLLEYKMYKYLSEELAVRREEAGVRFFRTQDLPKEVKNYQPPIDYEALLKGTDLQSLQKVFGEVLRRKKSRRDPIRSGFGKIRREQVSMDNKTLYIRAYLQSHPHTDFRALLESRQSREEVIVTFLILLELMKTQKVIIVQDSIGGRILVEATGTMRDLTEPDPAPGPVSAEAELPTEPVETELPTEPVETELPTEPVGDDLTEAEPDDDELSDFEPMNVDLTETEPDESELSEFEPVNVDLTEAESDEDELSDFEPDDDDSGSAPETPAFDAETPEEAESAADRLTRTQPREPVSVSVPLLASRSVEVTAPLPLPEAPAPFVTDSSGMTELFSSRMTDLPAVDSRDALPQTEPVIPPLDLIDAEPEPEMEDEPAAPHFSERLWHGRLPKYAPAADAGSCVPGRGRGSSSVSSWKNSAGGNRRQIPFREQERLSRLWARRRF